MTIIIILTLMLFCSCDDIQNSEVNDAENSNTIQQKDEEKTFLPSENKNLNEENYIKQLENLGFVLDVDLNENDIPTLIDVVDIVLPFTEYDDSLSVSAIPFTDVDWEHIHKIGYLYQNNIIFGVNDTTLGIDEPCDSATFLVLVMRLLGYDIDLYDDVYKKAQEIRLINGKYSKHLSNSIFVFSDAAKIIYQALWLKTDAGNGDLLGSVVLDEQSNADFEYLDFNIFGNQTTPIALVDFEKYKVNTSKIVDSKNKVKLKYDYNKELNYNITEDGYLQLSGTQELLDSHKIYFEKEILQQNNDYGMEFILKINSIGNEGNKKRSIISIIPRSADKEFNGYYAINYYAETVYVEGMTSNLFKCKWSLTNTNAPSGNEPIVENHLLLEENVDYKCRFSIENNENGDVVIEFYIDGPNIECDMFEPLIRYVDNSEYKIEESYNGPGFVYSARAIEEGWGYPAQIELDDIAIYSVDDFKKNTENYREYFGDEYCRKLHSPDFSKCSDEKGIVSTVDFLIRQGVLPKKMHFVYQSTNPIKRIDLLKVLVNYRGYRFESEVPDDIVFDKALEMGIIDESFDRKTEYITRNESAKLLYNISKYKKPVDGYINLISDEVSNEYAQYIDYCVQNYYIKLDEDMAFNGNDYLSISNMTEALCVIVNNINKNDNQPLRLPYIFDDYSIFQREKPIYIWGYGINNDKVTVEFNGQIKTTKVKDGRWQVILEEEEAGGPYTLKVSDSVTSIKRENIFVGEVFILAGQSNMEWELFQSDDYKGTVNRFSSYDTLHFFAHEKTLAFRGGESYGRWLKTYAKSYFAEGISGVGMFATEMLYKLNEAELDGVKVGLIPISYGGSTIEVLMPPTGNVQYNDAPLYNSYFNGYMKEMFPYSARAVLYYQGENSVQLRYSYEQYLRSLITDYKKTFGDENLPFYMVQLAAYGENYDDIYNTWPIIREIQTRTANTMENVSLVTAIDLGDKDNHLNIHPTNKKPIGQRLAYLMSDDIFGTDYNKKSPELLSYEIIDNEYVLTFDQDDIIIKEGDQDYNFDIYDGVLNGWKEAFAYIGEDNKVHVKSELVSKPDGIRYAWYNYMDVILFNSYDMPVMPFNTKVDLVNVPDFSELKTDDDTLNMPIHLLETDDYIINITKGFLLSQVISINANVVQLKQPIPDQKMGDEIIRLKNKGHQEAYIGTDETKVVIKNHGLKCGDFIINITRNSTIRKVEEVIDEDTFVVKKISNQTSFDSFIILDEIGVVLAE